jgi:hypothetical protein
MKVERFAGHHEEREALMLSVAGVMAIMLIESLVLLILYLVHRAQLSRASMGGRCCTVFRAKPHPRCRAASAKHFLDGT